MNDDEDILTGSSETIADDEYEETPDSVQALEGVAGMVGLACADLDEALGVVSESAAGAVALACAPWVRAALPLGGFG